MKRKTYCLILLLGLTAMVYGQNQTDENGKKHGKWIVYLDSYWKEIKDSSKASFYRYTVYDHGTNIYPMGPCGKKGWTLETTSTAKLLDGEFKWVNSRGQVSSTHSFKNGEYLNCKEYYTNGKVKQHFAYSMRYKNEPNTYCLYQYDKNEKLTFFVMRNGDNGWTFYQGSEDDVKK